MTDWNESGYQENSGIDGKFLCPKIYYLVYSQHPGLHYYSEDRWNFGTLVILMQAVTSGEQYCMLVERWNETWSIWISSHLEPSDLILVKNGYLNFSHFSQGIWLNCFHSSHFIYHSLFSHPPPPTHQSSRADCIYYQVPTHTSWYWT